MKCAYKRLQMNNTTNRYIKILTSMIIVMAVLVSAAVPVAASSADSGTEQLTVGVPADRCPIFYIDDDTDEIVGIGADRRSEHERLPGTDMRRSIRPDPR